MLHRWLNEIIISRLDEPVVLDQDILDSSAAFRNVSLNSSCQPDIVRSKHKNLKVHHRSEPLFVYGVYSLEDNNWGSFYCFYNVSALMQSEVIGWDIHVFAFDELCYFLEG